MKKVSLILTTFNNEANLPKTLESIESQDYPSIEVVIKDGLSKDGTMDIIEKYSKESKFEVKFTSTKDTGIYDAMNQGYALSTGDIVAFFNDRFTTKDAVAKLVNAIYEGSSEKSTVGIKEENEAEAADSCDNEIVGSHADLIYTNEDKTVRTWHMGEQTSLLLGWMPGHPTLFLKREVYEKYGLYKTDYKIAADYEFMVRILKDKSNKLSYVNESLVSMFYGGTSNSTFGSYIESLKEGHRALTSNKVHPAWIADCFRTARVLLQFESIMQFLKFGIVGLSNTIISYVLYLLVLWALKNQNVSWDYIAGNLIAFVLSVLWSFYWNNKYVFTKEEGKQRSLWKALLKTYVSYGFSGIILTNILAYLWVDILGISKLIAPIITLVATVPLNFIMNKLWAFKSK